MMNKDVGVRAGAANPGPAPGTTTDPDIAVKATGLSLSYGRTAAVDRADVTVKSGCITGLVGRNGSGKTTFMRLCAGRLHPTGGELLVFGAPPEDNPFVQPGVIYAVPDREYFRGLKLIEILKEYGLMFPRFDMAFARRLTDYFGLDEVNRYMRLSRGMAAAFNFVCAVATRAELTMLDEITLGMDVSVRKDVYEILLRDFSEHPRTFIVSSHLFGEAEDVMSDVILIDEGRVALHSDIDELRRGAYRVSGGVDAVRSFTEGREVIFSREGELGGEAVVKEQADEGVRAAAGKFGLTVSGVTPEEYCFYTIGVDKREALSCLWNE
jgi:ABC-2 type transport system ATP-binding protein